MTGLRVGDRLHHQVIVSAPRTEMWNFMCRPDWSEWVEGTLAVHDPSGPAALGMTYGETNRVLGPFCARSRWRVVAFDSPHYQRHEGSGLPLCERFAVEWRLDSVASGTAVSMTYEVLPVRWFGPVLYRIALRRRLRRSLQHSLRALPAALGALPRGDDE